MNKKTIFRIFPHICKMVFFGMFQLYGLQT